MKILVVPGDGIGPEITRATVAAIKALDAKYRLDLELDFANCGLESLQQHGTTLRDEDLERAQRADGVILGPMSIKDYPEPARGGVHVPAAFRKHLDLYANVRPSYVRAGLPSTVQGLDLVMVRENLEDFYVDRNMFMGVGEFMPTPDVVLAVGKITATGSRRVARVACEIASRRPRKKITIVHKNPVLKLYNGMFVDEARNVAREFPQLEIEDLLVDAVAALLIRTPQRFDVILIPNVFGDILSDEASELAGGLGLAASLNQGDRCSVANAGHGSAPDIAGRDIANPASLMLSAAMLFEHLGSARGEDRLLQAAASLTSAVDHNLGAPQTRTRDLGGALSTTAFAETVVQSIRKGR